MPDYSVFLLGWFLVLLSSIIKMRKFLLNRLCIYTYLCVLLLLLLIVDNSILNDICRNSYCYFASSPLLHLSPSPVRAHPLFPFSQSEHLHSAVPVCPAPSPVLAVILSYFPDF